MVVLGGLSILFKKQAVKGVVDFEDGEVFEVFLHAFNGEDFFDKRFSAYGTRGGISITHHPDENVRVKIAESKPIQTRLAVHRHDVPFRYHKYDMFGQLIANNESMW